MVWRCGEKRGKSRGVLARGEVEFGKRWCVRVALRMGLSIMMGGGGGQSLG